MRRLTPAVFAGCTVLLAACGPQTTTPAAPDIDAGTTWQLQEGSVPAGSLPVMEDYPITLTVEDGQVGGRSACNLYGGSITISGETIHIAQVGGTEMGCEPAVMSLESAYLAALVTVDRISRDGETLLLSGPQTELRFVALPPVPRAELVGTSWLLETLLDGDAASSTVGEPATLLLKPDGTIEASTGCRLLTGRYVINGGEVSVPELTASGDCPADVAPQDGHVIAVLEGFRASVDGDRLTLTGERGRGLVYRAS